MSTTIQAVSKNPHVQAAAVELLAVNLKHPNVTDEYGDEAGEVLTRCCSLMGSLSDDREDAVTDAIQGMALKMERALVGARLLSKRS